MRVFLIKFKIVFIEYISFSGDNSDISLPLKISFFVYLFLCREISVRGDTELVQDGLISSNNIEQEYS